MVGKLFAHLRQQYIGAIALTLVLSGGTAYALEGSNTVFSDDIVNGEVKNPDLAADSVGSNKIADRQVKNADLSIGASASNTIADGGVQGIDVLNNSLTGDDVNESTLGSVPSAANADQLGGQDASEFAAATHSTVFRTSSVVNQPNGQRRTVVAATGLSPATYLVSYRMYMTNPQRYECGVMSGESFLTIPRYVITTASPETLQDTFVGTFSSGEQQPRLVCTGFTQDWSASNVELHFIKIDGLIEGTEG